MNKVFLVGNLTKDPELSKTNSDISLCKFSIAVQKRFASTDSTADFFNIITWRGTADNCAKYLKKGSKVAIVGFITVRSYEDKDNIRRTAVEITADEVEFLSSKSSTADDGDDFEAKPKIKHIVPIADDDLPF